MAVAAVIAHRKNGKSAGLTEADETNYVDDKLPPAELREADMFLGLQLGGTWHRRRVIFTKDIIAFADEEVMIDHILLAEVEFVRDVGPMDDDMQNFLVSIVDAQFGSEVVHDENFQVEQPTISQLADMSGSFNSAFTAIFTVELFLNIFGNGFRRFLASGWNWLDFFIVSMSLVDLGVENIPKWLVGLMRAIRVIRLFGRVKELKKMSTAVTASVFPMMNAFIILIVILCIFSILGVSLFSQAGPDEFGRFNRAFMTCFRLVTGDSWPESLPMLKSDGAIDVKASVFFCSFTIVVAWIILQVSVAVLIDNFVAASGRLENEAKMKLVMEKKKVNMYKNPLEPLVAKLAMSYVDRADLEAKLKALFQSLDSDGSGDLSSSEFCAAIRKLNFTPCIYVTEPDFKNLSRNGALCNQDGTIDNERFRDIMMEQIRAYTMTLLTVHSTYLTPEEEEFSRRGTLKMIMMDQQQMQERMEKSISKGKSDEQIVDPKIESPSKTQSCEQSGCFDAGSSMASSDTTQQAMTHLNGIAQDDEPTLVRTDDKWRPEDPASANGAGSTAKARRSHKQYNSLTDESARHRTSKSLDSVSAVLQSSLMLDEGGVCSSESTKKMTFLTRWRDYTVRKQATLRTSKNSFEEQEAHPGSWLNDSESTFSDRRFSPKYETTSPNYGAVSSSEHPESSRTSGNSIAVSSLQVAPCPPGNGNVFRRSSSLKEKKKHRASLNDAISKRDPNLDSTDVDMTKRTSGPNSKASPLGKSRSLTTVSEGTNFGAEEHFLQEQLDAMGLVSNTMSTLHDALEGGNEATRKGSALPNAEEQNFNASARSPKLLAPAQLPRTVPSPLTRAERPQYIGEVRLEQSNATLKCDKNVMPLDVVLSSRRSKRDSSSRGITDSTTLVSAARFSRRSSDMPQARKDNRYDDLQREDDCHGEWGVGDSCSFNPGKPMVDTYRDLPRLEDVGDGYEYPSPRGGLRWGENPRHQRPHGQHAETSRWGQSWASLEGWGASRSHEEGLAERQASRGAPRKLARSC